MAKNLVIVESPNKISKIQSFLGNDYYVLASIGHIRDLATFGTRLRLGLNLETMEPNYINLSDKKEIIKQLIDNSNKVENIFLATDPDREGEGIAWHISQIIENKNAKIYRTSFNEITKESVLSSINNPKNINMNLVNSQESRRILDRILGFRLSYLTNKKISAKSAGRVKSAVLKLIIDRENEIEKFIPKFWWTIEGEIDQEKFLINVYNEKFSEKKYKTKIEADNILKSLSNEFKFINRKESLRKISPPKPLEMATYLISMYNQYSMSNLSSTFASQSLYEKGLITYPRTDSTRISSVDFIKSTEDYVNKNYGKEYYIGNSISKISKGEQDAHEAIRPTDIKKTPSSIIGLKINEKKAYTLIWNTTIKSFLKEGINKNIKDIYKNGEEYFLLKHSYPLEIGFRIIDGLKIIEESIIKNKIIIDTKKIKLVDHQTNPPAKYNPSSLIKLMKEVGIGRPSTYSGVISGLVGFGYLENKSGILTPTSIAKEVNNLLQFKFKDIINEKYTAEMENTLDEISKGNIDSKKYLLKFFKEFEPRVEEAIETIQEKPKVYVGKNCSNCSDGKLIIRRGKFGEFISCDKFPVCKYTESLKPKEKPKKTNIKCIKCGEELVVRFSDKTKNKFIACSNFPKCKFIQPENETIEILFNLGEINQEQKNERLKKLEKKLNKKNKNID